MRSLVRDKGFGAVAAPVVCPGPGGVGVGAGPQGVPLPFALQ